MADRKVCGVQGAGVQEWEAPCEIRGGGFIVWTVVHLVYTFEKKFEIRVI